MQSPRQYLTDRFGKLPTARRLPLYHHFQSIAVVPAILMGQITHNEVNIIMQTYADT